MMSRARAFHGSVACAFSAAALGLAAACGDPAGPVPWQAADLPGRIVVAFDADLRHWRRDAYRLDSAWIATDTLFLRVSHGGGCARHRYALVAWNGWLESFPVQVDALLAHDSGNDPCDALLTPRLRFDLVPLRDAYRATYREEHATIVIRLTDPASVAHPRLATIRYEF